MADALVPGGCERDAMSEGATLVFSTWRPWGPVIAGIALIVSGSLIGYLGITSHRGLAVALLVVGTLTVAAASSVRKPSFSMLLTLAFSAFLSGLGFDWSGWDSTALLMRVLMAVAVVGAILTVSPPRGRNVIISALVSLHFCALVTANACRGPGNWVAHQLWTHFYRPYLQFMALDVAYRYREPSQLCLLWFCVQYETDCDGTPNWRWIKVPDFDVDRRPARPDGTRLSRLELTRYQALGVSIDMPNPQSPSSEELRRMAERRYVAGEACGIPMHRELPVESQYRAPHPKCVRWLQSYIRHVARTCPHRQKPSLRVVAVKAYVVIHVIASPQQVASNWDLLDPTLYFPYFMGEFDANGVPRDTGGATDAEDPFLYWLIPIVRNGDNSQELASGQAPGKGSVTNFVFAHAGVRNEGPLP